MAKKSKRRRSRPIEGAGRSEPTDSPASNSGEVATVAWMLSLLATLIAEVLGIFIRLLMLQLGFSDRLQVLSGTLLLVAVLAGVLTLILTPVTLRLRSIPPPYPIVVSAVVIGLIPLATVLILVLR